MLAEGSYRTLRSSGLDFTKLLRCPDETPPAGSDDETATADDDASPNVPRAPAKSRRNSGRSVSSSSPQSSVDESRLDGARTEPAEVTETHTSGNVANSVYLSYLTAGGNLYRTPLLITLCICTQMLCIGGDFWLNYWYVS